MAKKNTTRNIILLALAAGVGIFAFDKAKAFSTMTFKLKSIAFGNVVFGQPLPAIITFTLINSTTSPVTINNIYGAISINNSIVAQLSESAISSVTIPANNSIDVPVSFNIGAGNLLTQLASFVTSGTPLTTNFNGSIIVENTALPIPINQTLTA